MRSQCKGKILAMDDEELIRNLLNAILSRFGYFVALAKHGQDAFDQYRSEAKRGKAFDLVIIDLNVRGRMSCRETFAKLREFDPNIKAVVSSGYLPQDAMEEYKEYGFVDVLSKPFNLKGMEYLLDRAMVNGGQFQ